MIDIKAICDIKVVPVPVPEWGGTVFVRTLTGRERAGLESWATQPANKDRAREFLARVVAVAMCDADGKRVLADDAADWLLDKSASAVDRVADVALDINLMTPESRERARSDFFATTPPSTGTASHGSSAGESATCSER